MRFFNFAAALIATSALANGDVTAIRTFVNGNSKGVHDLHVEYSNPLNGARVLGRFPGAKAPEINMDGTKLDIAFDGNLPASDSITIAATTPAGTPDKPQQSLTIKRWWWTDDNHNRVKRKCKQGKEEIEIDEYGPTERGDEDPCGPGKEDVYTIWNKRHHWGGKARLTDKVKIIIDIGPLLAKAPKGMDKDQLTKEYRGSHQTVDHMHQHYDGVLSAQIRTWQ